MTRQSCDGSNFARILTVVITTLGFTFPALTANAAKHVTVAQLEQTLSAFHGRQDSEIADIVAYLRSIPAGKQAKDIPLLNR